MTNSASPASPKIRTTIMGFDYGEKRIGVAIGESDVSIATEITTLNNNENTLWAECDALVKEWRPQIFVVGLPLNSDGTPSEFAQKTKAFGSLLLERYKKEVYYHDEYLTSHMADILLEQSTPEGKRKRNKKRQSRRDQIAARLILEGFINARK